jgi:glutathione S-transferase
MADPILHQFPPAGELPSISPYCWKVQMALNLAGISFRIENTLMAKRANPAGKLPYLEWDGDGVEDSTQILRVIDQRSDAVALWPTDPGPAALVDILEDWADESLYWHGVYAKFEDDDGWSYVKPALGASVSNAAMRAAATTLARRDTRSKLKSQGLSTRDRALVLGELERHLDSLETRITGRPYLVGDAITAADLAVTAMLAQLTMGLTPDWGRLIAQREQLSDYLRRVRRDTGFAPVDEEHHEDEPGWGE